MNSTQTSDVFCATAGHEDLRATRYVSCEGDGRYPYCDECARILLKDGETDGGPTEDRDELIRKAMQALRSTGIELALRERAEVVLRAIGAIQ